jgi:TLC domain
MTTDMQTYLQAVVVTSVLRLVLAGAYHKRLAKMPCLFSLVSHGLDDGVRRKLHETMWYSVWHTLSFAANLYMLLNSSWFKPIVFNMDFDLFYVDLNSQEFEPYGRFFYISSLGFWTSCMLFLGIETIRKDFMQLVIHHILTVSLIVISFMYNFHRFGLLVLLLHDVVDVFLYTAKSLNYKKYQKSADIAFVIFAVLFLIARLVLYPIYCIVPSFYAMCRSFQGTDLIIPLMLPIMLTGLYGLQVLWWLLIWRMIQKTFAGEKMVDKDCRSEDEKED